MNLDAIPAGLAVFVDANALLYYFTAHPHYGSACQNLLDRIENKEIAGFTSAHVLTEVVDRLMTHIIDHDQVGFVILGRDGTAAGRVACELLRRTTAVVVVAP